ncbi:hypothetical protein [Microbacterium panaciterrae]
MSDTYPAPIADPQTAQDPSAAPDSGASPEQPVAIGTVLPN